MEFPVGPEELWAALTQPEQVSAWFGAEVLELEVRPGGRVAFRDDDGTIRRGLVQDVERPRRFAFRWLPITQRGTGDWGPLPATLVEFVLQERDRGTLLTVRESPSRFDSEPSTSRVLLSA
jgi:uncharacterized protein YndB with AHSA1/START domain